MIGEWTNHLWQSTLFVVAVALLAIVFRNNQARVRYWLWLSASLKFVIPFSVLTSLGNRLWGVLFTDKIATETPAPAVSHAMMRILQPIPETLSFVPFAPRVMNWTSIAIICVWASGFAAVAVMRLCGWLRILAAVRASTPTGVPAAVAARSSPGLLEPGVVGFFRPILLLPEGIAASLSYGEMNAILAHEICHLRRRDNLTAAIHMLVEALFWFYPLVWWIGAKLVAEREMACDESVVEAGNAPEVYAKGILKVCQHYQQSPLACASGVSGADIKKRVEAIMKDQIAVRLNAQRKLLLAASAALAVAAPLLVGILSSHQAIAQKAIAPTPLDKPCVNTTGITYAIVITITESGTLLWNGQAVDWPTLDRNLGYETEDSPHGDPHGRPVFSLAGWGGSDSQLRNLVADIQGRGLDIACTGLGR